MDHSIAQLTWQVSPHYDVTRQIAIPYEIDPLDLSEAEIRDLAISQGFNIHGDLSWEILIDNSRFCYMTDELRRAIKLSEKIDRLIADLQDATAELVEIVAE